MSRILASVAGWSIARPWFAIPLVLALTTVLGGGFALAEEADITELFVSSDMPEKLAFDTIQSTFDRGDTAFVLFVDDDPASADVVRAQHEASIALSRLDFVRSTTSVADLLRMQGVDIDGSSDDALEAATAQLLEQRPDVAQRLLVDDASLMTVEVETDAEAPDVVAGMDDVVEDLPGDVTAAGGPYNEVAFNDSGASDVQILMPLALLAIVITLGIVFRRVVDVVLPLLTVFVALAWAYGSLGYLQVPLSPLLFSVMPVILGLGIDYMLHIVYDYRDRTDGTPWQRFRATGRSIGAPVFFTAMTTSIGFGSFLVSPIPQVRHWGILIGLGALSAFVLGFLFLPALYRIRLRRKAAPPHHGLESFLRRVADHLVTRRRIVLASLAVLTLVLAGGILLLEVDDTVDVDLDEDHPHIVALERIEERFGGQRIGLILIDGVEDHRDEVVVLEDRLARDDRISFVDGPATRLAAAGPVPDGAAWRDALMQEDFDDVVRDDLAVVSFGYDFADEEAVIKDVDGLLDDDGLDSTLTGQAAIQLKSQGATLDSLIMSTTVAAGLVIVLLFVVVREWLLGAVTALPLVITAVWQFGLQGYLGIPLNAVTGVTTAMVIGIGVDYALHLSLRIKSERRCGADRREAARAAVVHVGKPVLAGSITTVAAFSVLAFSQTSQLSQFGIVAAIVVSCAFLVSLALVPTIMAGKEPAAAVGRPAVRDVPYPVVFKERRR